MKRWGALIVVVMVAALGGCDGDVPYTPAEPTRTTIPVEADPVPWEDYDASVKVRIDELIAAGDCAGLQDQFDAAWANSDQTRDRTGHGNEGIMRYINDAMTAAGC